MPAPYNDALTPQQIGSESSEFPEDYPAEPDQMPTHHLPATNGIEVEYTENHTESND